MNICPCLQLLRVQRARERMGWTITMYLDRGVRVRTESVFKQNHRIYFDSLIIAILNIAKKNNLINTSG